MKSQRRNRPDRRRDGGAKRQDEGEHSSRVIGDSLIMKQFSEYAQELDQKHDKYERIVKHSRDITIESKRIIFLLHSLDTSEKRIEVLSEAESRLKNVASSLFQSISKELKGEDIYQYLRAYSAGLQEFIEAITFFHYLMYKKLEPWDTVQKMLMYSESDSSTMPENNNLSNSSCVPIPPPEYVLGVADLTGELMRNCINNLGCGNLEVCMKTCTFVKEIYNGFLGVGNSGPKEFSRKLFTLRQSLSKMENACYAIRVRGSEIPKNMLADVLRDSSGYDVFEEDEGFY